MVNLDEGHAVMLEIDGVVVPGWLTAGVKGMMGFIAPEVLTQRISSALNSFYGATVAAVSS